MKQTDFLEIVHLAEKLKDTPRHCTTSRGRVESVAEHSWRISFMAMLLKDEFPDADINKVVSMCIIHDLGECFTGDIPVFLKTNKDRLEEERILNSWIDTLPESTARTLNSLFDEMNAQKTLESKIYKSLDKLEAVIQHNEAPISTWAENEYELNRTYAFDAVDFSEWMKNLRLEILSETENKIQKGE